MKNRNLAAYIIISVIAIILVGGFLFIKAYTPKYKWGENLTVKNNEPYGLSILYNLIKKSYPKDAFIEIKHDDYSKYFKEHTNSSYIFIGTNNFVDSTNLAHIIKHVEKGNNAFIGLTYSYNLFNLWLSDTIAGLTNSINQDSIFTKFTSAISDTSPYYFRHQILKKTGTYYWQYFDSAFFELVKECEPIILSTIGDNKPNFVKLKMGQGNMYLHITPIFFSNYHLLRDSTYAYFSSIWNEIGSDKIIWDNFSTRYYNNPSYSYLKESPLRYILSHKSLRWAWYTLLATILLFIIFQSKRKQNTIPLIKQKKNNTLEYAKAIGALYFQAKSHKAITDEMIQQLYSYVKARYNIKIGKDKDKILTRLARQSGIKEKTLSDLFKLEIKLKYNEQADSEQLYKLYNLVDYFYKNCN